MKNLGKEDKGDEYAHGACERSHAKVDTASPTHGGGGERVREDEYVPVYSVTIIMSIRDLMCDPDVSSEGRPCLR
jgi:hypothetical protein